MTFEKPLYLFLLLGLPLIPLIVKLGAFRPFRVKMTLSNWGETKTVWSLPFYKFLRNLYCFFGFSPLDSKYSSTIQDNTVIVPFFEGGSRFTRLNFA